VLKNFKLNESDKILTIYTQNYGKIRAIAKGVRKTKSQFGSSLENLTLVNILAFKGKNLNIISQTEIIASFFSECKDLYLYGLALQCAEIIDKVTADEDSNESLYLLAKDVFSFLRVEKNPLLLIAAFKWKLLSLMGYSPKINYCANCNQKKVVCSESYMFDIQNGGILCSDCQKIQSYYKIIITKYCLQLLGRILVADLSKIHNKKVSKSDLDDLNVLTDKYLEYHFEIVNLSKNFLNRIKLL